MNYKTRNMKPENPNAFPIALKDNINPHHKDAKGMELRDYFAIDILNGLLSAPDWTGIEMKLESGKTIKENMAIYSYGMADIMLKARNEQG